MVCRNRINKRTRFEVLKRDDFKCHYCGKSASDTELEIDHVVPFSKGGKDDIDNMVACCKSCNVGKSDIDLNNHKVIEKQKRTSFTIYPSVEKEFRNTKEASGMTWNDFIIQLLDVYKEKKK